MANDPYEAFRRSRKWVEWFHMRRRDYQIMSRDELEAKVARQADIISHQAWRIKHLRQENRRVNYQKDYSRNAGQEAPYKWRNAYMKRWEQVMRMSKRIKELESQTEIASPND